MSSHGARAKSAHGLNTVLRPVLPALENSCRRRYSASGANTSAFNWPLRELDLMLQVKTIYLHELGNRNNLKNAFMDVVQGIREVADKLDKDELDTRV